MARSNRLQSRVPLGLLVGLAALVVPPGPGATAQPDAWTYADTQPAVNPQPWNCPSADPGAQTIRQAHNNWHCTFPNSSAPSWGLAFVGFHRQFVEDYDLWRLDLGGDRTEIWDFLPNAVIPGDDETTATAYTHCPEYPGSSRPAGALCSGCMALPANLNVMNIGSFASLGHAGAALQSSGWHDSFHLGVGSAGGDCNDIAFPSSAPRDPVFWMGHKKVDDVARTWLQTKAADIVVVIDRSGSMNDDCDDAIDCSGPNPPGDAGCKLNAAKNAALQLADMLDDAGVDGDQHRIGLVSFASGATQDVGLTAASGVVTDNGMDETAFEAAIAGMQACGSTAIGDGIQAAIDMLEDTGTNPHQAIVVLTDGMQNAGTDIAVVAGGLGLMQLCAVGIGSGGYEADLRTVAESHGGIFVAKEAYDSHGLDLEKFFVACFAQIFDDVINEDPRFTLPAGHVASDAFPLEVLPQSGKLMFVSGFRPPVDRQPGPDCRLRWLVTTPGGDLVRAGDAGVETGQGPQWAFQRVRLPYLGAHEGGWTARLVRPHRIVFHGYPTDAYKDPAAGVALVREEIHRVVPDGAADVLYYEDGNLTGASSYAAALAAEQGAGLVGNVAQAADAAEFHDLLLQDWDLIVFARQVDPTPQVYDSRLADALCRVRAGLVTDLCDPAGVANGLLACVGLATEPGDYQLVQGDGQLLTGPLELLQLAYPVTLRYLFRGQGHEPLADLGWSGQGVPVIVGTGTDCGAQEAFYTSHTSGVGRVEPANIRPRVLVGQRILATFEMRELNRPIGGWDAVSARVAHYLPDGTPAGEFALYDDGTNGDKAIGNNTWSHLLPGPATVPGPHRLRGIFDLTLDGRTVRREAECAVIVEPEPDPDACTRLACHERFAVTAGWKLKLGPCLGNLCLEERTYSVVATADQPWLCVPDGAGGLLPVGQQYQFATPAVVPGKPDCFYDTGPLHLCVPPEAPVGATATVLVEVYDATAPGLPPQVCRTVYEVAANGLSPVDDVPAPAGFALHEARPNPFNPSTEITFSLPGAPGRSHHATLRVYDTRGTLVRTLVDGPLASGLQSRRWDGRDDAGRTVPAGVYLFRLEAAGQSANGKVVMLK